MPLQIIEAPTIAAGEALSGPLDVGDANELVRITMPATWKPALLSFQISSDGEYYNDLFEPDGSEIMINVVAGTAVLVPEGWARAVRFMRFRSGTRERPVPQDEAKTFAVAVRTPDEPAFP